MVALLAENNSLFHRFASRPNANTDGKGSHQLDIHQKVNFTPLAKVLLVDDELEFVQTLAERLMLRDIRSSVAHDGETALQLVDEEPPGVMVLDLNMPDIDGIEVLKRVKTTRPEIEVIILTGHGSETDRVLCLKMGAFAYLQKPVGIELLSKTLADADAKIKER